MRHELMQDKVSYTDSEPLTHGEIILMKDKILKQLIIYVPGYLVLTGIGIYIWFTGPISFNNRVTFHSRSWDADEKYNHLFRTVVPYFCIFLFLLSTIFLTIYYFKSVHPFIKDIRKGKKLLVFYEVKKTAMTLFRRYYISIPLYSNQQIEINKEDFENINEGDLLCLEMGPSSTYILKLRKKDTYR
ncbi:MAG TPA: hypothetical protein VK588_11055 [Chitinophagaceae bacterium]|nr:hypothetical protein [Chitinophagaceae bacterium]